MKYGCIAEAIEDFTSKVKTGQSITTEMARAAYTPGGSMPKELGLMYWQSMEPDQPIAPHFEALPSKSAGSTYGACGIRIDGNPEFIDAVLSRLKDLIELESATTRLGFSRSRVKATEIKGDKKSFDNAARNAEVVYIRLHERGIEAQMANALMTGLGRAAKANDRTPCVHTSPLFD